MIFRLGKHTAQHQQVAPYVFKKSKHKARRYGKNKKANKLKIDRILGV